MSILGNRVTRSEDPRFITGTATFGDDVKAQGALHATFVRSILPHARITGIDTSAVSEIPGARAFTAADIGLDPLPVAMPGLEEQMPRPVIASEVARFVGEIVAVVLTEDRLQGAGRGRARHRRRRRAAGRRPTPHAALAGEALLFPDVGTNVCARFPNESPDDALFDGCDVVVTTSVHEPAARLVPDRVPRRRRGVGRGRPPHAVGDDADPARTRDALAARWASSRAGPRARRPTSAAASAPRPARTPRRSSSPGSPRELGRPVRWTETRTENMIALGHGRAQLQEITVGGDRDGTLKAVPA